MPNPEHYSYVDGYTLPEVAERLNITYQRARHLKDKYPDIIKVQVATNTFAPEMLSKFEVLNSTMSQGRPTLLTEEIIQEVEADLLDGHTKTLAYKSAAVKRGINPGSPWNWEKAGKRIAERFVGINDEGLSEILTNKELLYCKFYRAVKTAILSDQKKFESEAKEQIVHGARTTVKTWDPVDQIMKVTKETRRTDPERLMKFMNWKFRGEYDMTQHTLNIEASVKHDHQHVLDVPIDVARQLLAARSNGELSAGDIVDVDSYEIAQETPAGRMMSFEQLTTGSEVNNGT